MNGMHELSTPHRILVIANETVDGQRLHDTVLARATGNQRVEVLVVCPALNSRLRFWLSDDDGARHAAEERPVHLVRVAASIE